MDGVSWADLSVPWSESNRVHFHDAVTVRPEGLLAVAATLDSALLVAGGDGKGEVTELPSEGVPEVIGTGVRGIAIGDAAGHLAAWTETTETGRVRVVAYATDSREVVATLSIADGMDVYAVHGQTVVLADGDDSYAWIPGARDDPLARVVPGGAGHLVTDLSDQHVFTTDFHESMLLSLDGEVVARFDEVLEGTFDPSGAFVALYGGGGRGPAGTVQLLSAETGETTPLDVEGNIDSIRWDPSGALIVRAGVRPDGIATDGTLVEYVVCTPGSSRCDPILGGATAYYEAEGVEVSAFGQIVVASE